MKEEEIVVALTGHDHEIGSLKHRMIAQEEQAKATQAMVVSIEKLALNMERMAKELEKQGERLGKLESEPAARMSQIKTAIITALATAVIGSIVGAILLLA